MKWKVGDQIICAGVVREIVAVRPTGYDWKYPSMGDVCKNGQRNLFLSENSNDPFFELLAWELYGAKHKAAAREWAASMDSFLEPWKRK